MSKNNRMPCPNVPCSCTACRLLLATCRATTLTTCRAMSNASFWQRNVVPLTTGPSSNMAYRVLVQRAVPFHLFAFRISTPGKRNWTITQSNYKIWVWCWHALVLALEAHIFLICPPLLGHTLKLFLPTGLQNIQSETKLTVKNTI